MEKCFPRKIRFKSAHVWAWKSVSKKNCAQTGIKTIPVSYPNLESFPDPRKTSRKFGAKLVPKMALRQPWACMHITVSACKETEGVDLYCGVQGISHERVATYIPSVCVEKKHLLWFQCARLETMF